MPEDGYQTPPRLFALVYSIFLLKKNKLYSAFCYCNIVHFSPTSKKIIYLESAMNADNDRIGAHFQKWGKKFGKFYVRVGLTPICV